MAKVGQTIGGRFDLEQELGAGGMAVVWRARDRDTGEHVAIKILRRLGEQTLECFDREARVLAELDVPGVVRYVAHGLKRRGAGARHGSRTVKRP